MMEKTVRTSTVETKLPPDRVLTTALRFFSSRKYDVQSQGSNWMTVRAHVPVPYAALIAIGLAVSCLGGLSLGLGLRSVGRLSPSERPTGVQSLLERWTPGLAEERRTQHRQAVLLVVSGSLGAAVGLGLVAYGEVKSKQAQEITLVAEGVPAGSGVTIDYPYGAKVAGLVKALVRLLSRQGVPRPGPD